MIRTQEQILSAEFRTRNGILRDYVILAKPRIAILLVFTTVTAMIIADGGIPSLDILVATIIGGFLASGGSSAINQYYDRDMDAKMSRTKKPPIMVATRISRGGIPPAAIIIAVTVVKTRRTAMRGFAKIT